MTAPLAFLLVACSARQPESVAGPVVFFDAAGNRMLVDVEATRPSPAPAVDAPVSDPGSVVEGKLPAPGPVRTDIPETVTGATGLSTADYPDADELLAKSRESEKERFFVIPDGTGRTSTLSVDGGTLDMARSARSEPLVALSWQSCRIVAPLLAREAALAQQLEFPVNDGRHKYAGYMLVLPDDAAIVELWAYEVRGERAAPLLARVDEEGRIVAVVNNMPTESIPESRFAYARLGGKRMLSGLPAGTARRIAVLDSALMGPRMLAKCLGEGAVPEAGAQSSTPAAAVRSRGRVSLNFLAKR